MNTFLSKSQFMRGLKCHKSLWLYKNRPDLRTPPTEFQQAVFDTGTVIGRYARGLFPGGEEIRYEGSSFTQKIRMTKELMAKGAETIYEATFSYDGITVMADILHRGDDGWEIYEVKGSTVLREMYLDDLSVQYYVLPGIGLRTAKASLVYLNNEYVKYGDINIRELFRISDMTAQVRKRHDFIKEEIEDLRLMLQGGCPDIDIGVYCTSPYDCDFMEYCWSHVPQNSVFDLRDRGVDKFRHYYNGMVTFSDLDMDELNYRQKMQVEAELGGEPVINRVEIRKFLDELYYPQYYLDFETFMPPIPVYDGTRPYQPVPFQYSLHVKESESSDPGHYEFLAEAGEDPREKIISDLITIIPDHACIISYNSAYEKRILRMMSEQFPAFSDELMKICGNMVDLMIPFKNRYYYTKEMKGSYSIKYVLPALVPGLHYEGMAVRGGGEAMNIYSTLHLISDRAEVERRRRDLLAYCRLDTLGMVKIVEKLQEICSGG